MSSEIELVYEVQSANKNQSKPSASSDVDEVQSADRNQSQPSASSDVPEKSRRNDVYDAAAWGDLEKLRRLVEREGRTVTEPDGSGYYALQWAALNNHTAAAQYIIEHGGDLNATDSGKLGQTALH